MSVSDRLVCQDCAARSGVGQFEETTLGILTPQACTIVIAVDMGAGGPVADFERIKEEADTATFRAMVEYVDGTMHVMLPLGAVLTTDFEPKVSQ